MLTTSVAYGHFKYQERIEFVGIEKNPTYGNAYVSTFLDHEIGRPKIQPGQCRVVKRNLPDDIRKALDNEKHDEILKMVKEKDKDHYYFYWMRENPNEIESFEKSYRDAYNLKYAGMVGALRGKRSGYHTARGSERTY